MNCDFLARWYRWLEYASFGGELQRRRSEFLSEAADARQILLLGDGDGRFLAALLNVNAYAEVDFVDSSEQMLALARRRAGKEGKRVRFHHADALTQPIFKDRLYDLVATHFFLDCFATEQLPGLVGRIAAAAKPNAKWLVSEFRMPKHGLASLRAKVWISGLYTIFRWTTGLAVRRLPDYRAALENAGFCLRKEVITQWGLLTSEHWERVGDFTIDSPDAAHLHFAHPEACGAAGLPTLE